MAGGNASPTFGQRVADARSDFIICPSAYFPTSYLRASLLLTDTLELPPESPVPTPAPEGTSEPDATPRGATSSPLAFRERSTLAPRAAVVDEVS